MIFYVKVFIYKFYGVLITFKYCQRFFRQVHLPALHTISYILTTTCSDLFCGYIFMDDTRDRGGSSDRDGSDSSRRKSHHQRHTARQIQRLEGYRNL